MAGSALNVVQSRDIVVFDAPYSASNAMPANSAAGTAWGAPYRDVGYTEGGVGFAIGTSYEDVNVDQEIDPIGVIASGRDIRIRASLAEFTLANLQAAVGQGTLATVAAGAGTRGNTDLALSNTIAVAYRTVGFEVKHGLGDNEAIRVMAWRGQSRAAVEAAFAAGAKAVIPLELQAFPDPNNANRVMTIRDIIPAL